MMKRPPPVAPPGPGDGGHRAHPPTHGWKWQKSYVIHDVNDDEDCQIVNRVVTCPRPESAAVPSNTSAS